MNTDYKAGDEMSGLETAPERHGLLFVSPTKRSTIKMRKAERIRDAADAYGAGSLQRDRLRARVGGEAQLPVQKQGEGGERTARARGTLSGVNGPCNIENGFCSFSQFNNCGDAPLPGCPTGEACVAQQTLATCKVVNASDTFGNPVDGVTCTVTLTEP